MATVFIYQVDQSGNSHGVVEGLERGQVTGTQVTVGNPGSDLHVFDIEGIQYQAVCSSSNKM